MDQSDNHTEKKSMGEEIGGAIGQEVGAAVGKEVADHLEEKRKHRKDKKEKGPITRRFGYLIVIIFNFLFLWVINNYADWGWTFITSDWSEVVAVVRLSLYVSLMVYGAFILYDQKHFFFAGRLVTDVLSAYVSLRFFQVFPFDFDHLFGGWSWLNSVFPWVLIIGIVGVGIGLIVRTVKLISGKQIYD